MKDTLLENLLNKFEAIESSDKVPQNDFNDPLITFKLLKTTDNFAAIKTLIEHAEPTWEWYTDFDNIHRFRFDPERRWSRVKLTEDWFEVGFGATYERYEYESTAISSANKIIHCVKNSPRP